MTTNLDGSPELWFQPPPGWLEMTAFTDEAAALEWLDHWLEPDSHRLDESVRDALADTLRRAYAVTAESALVSSGVVVTALSDEVATMWHYGVATIRTTHSALREIDPVALGQRIIGAGQSGAVEETEEFTTADGRPGAAFYTTAAGAPDLAANVPQAEPDRLGVCYALVPVREAADWTAVVTGIAPNVDERRAMAVGVAMIAATVQARPAGDAGPAPDRVILDAADGGRAMTSNNNTEEN